MTETPGNIDDLMLWKKFLADDHDAMKEIYQNLFGKLVLFSYALTKTKRPPTESRWVDLTHD